METGEMSPHLSKVLAYMYEHGTANMEEVSAACHITDDETYEALEELVEWGSIIPPKKKDEYNTYRTPGVVPTKRQIKKAMKKNLPLPIETIEGRPIPFESEVNLFNSEYSQQYRGLPFWKRSIILLAGIAMNLLFAILAFIVIYSIIGVDIQLSSGEIVHHFANPIESIMSGFVYIGMVFQMILGLFNPMTAGDVVSQSTSIVGIAVMAPTFFEQGIANALFFMSAVSVSLGLMNLLPIPPLDGGRFVIEIFQKISKREVSQKALSYMSAAGMALFGLFFIVMLNQDIQRLLTGFWN